MPDPRPPKPGLADPGGELVIAVDDAFDPDVYALLEHHLAMAHRLSPPEHVHALDATRLADPALTFVSARRLGSLLGVGALRHLDTDRGELKSMHTAQEARRQGVGAAVLGYLLEMAAARHYRRVVLETGTHEAFAPARRLYARAGFGPCPPFGEYTDNPHSICMVLELPPGR